MHRQQRQKHRPQSWRLQHQHRQQQHKQRQKQPKWLNNKDLQLLKNKEEETLNKRNWKDNSDYNTEHSYQHR